VIGSGQGLDALVMALSSPDHPLGKLVAQLLAPRDDGPEVALPAPRAADPTRAALRRRCALLSRQNRLVASALGACRCWGCDDACTSCAGRGAPGWRPPHADAFALCVAPFVLARPELVRALLERAQPPAAGPDEPLPVHPPTN
jgi:hypothetical protein